MNRMLNKERGNLFSSPLILKACPRTAAVTSSGAKLEMKNLIMVTAKTATTATNTKSESVRSFCDFNTHETLNITALVSALLLAN